MRSDFSLNNVNIQCNGGLLPDTLYCCPNVTTIDIHLTLRGLQATHTSTLNRMLAKLGTDYEIRNRLFFAVLEALLLFNL